MNAAIVPFRLLIISDSQQEAQRLISMFQNAGKPCRAQHINTEEAFDKIIEEKVKNIIVEQLGVSEDQVKPEAKFIEDLGADSLDTVELVMAFEEEFGIEVPDEDAEKLQSVGDVIAYVNNAS